MKFITIEKSVFDKVPSGFKRLPADASYKITKLEAKETGKVYVKVGETYTGKLSIIDKGGDPAVALTRGNDVLISTSKIVGIVDEAKEAVVFETNGGVYRVESTKT